jgi:hypothetical protein
MRRLANRRIGKMQNLTKSVIFHGYLVSRPGTFVPWVRPAVAAAIMAGVRSRGR